MRALTLVLALAAGTATAQDRPTVATVNYPLTYFAERLGGDDVEVLFDVPADRDPAFWRPGLAQISDIQSADVIALNGAGFAAWTTKVSLPRSRLVDTTDGFQNAFISTEDITHSHGADGEHSHTATASYTWLDFGQAAQQAQALATAMDRRMPEVDGIDGRLQALTADLDQMAQTATEAAASLQGQTILATHPRYQYFARAYGLEIDAMAWDAGAMPSDAQWAELERRMQDSGATLLIWEATPPEGALERAETLGLTSIVFPPLANRPESGDFVSSMTDVLTQLGQAASE